MNADDLTRLLDELGQRLGPAGERVFALTVRQVTIEATVWITALVAVSILCAFATVITVRLRGGFNDSDGAVFWAFATAASIIALVLIGGGCLITLLNPEYAALVRIIDTVKP